MRRCIHIWTDHTSHITYHEYICIYFALKCRSNSPIFIWSLWIVITNRLQTQFTYFFVSFVECFFFASLKIILMAKPFQRDDIYTNIFIGMWINTNRHTYFTISHVPPHIWCLNHFYLVWSGSYHILMCVECC